MIVRPNNHRTGIFTCFGCVEHFQEMALDLTKSCLAWACWFLERACYRFPKVRWGTFWAGQGHEGMLRRQQPTQWGFSSLFSSLSNDLQEVTPQNHRVSSNQQYCLQRTTETGCAVTSEAGGSDQGHFGNWHGRRSTSKVWPSFVLVTRTFRLVAKPHIPPGESTAFGDNSEL